MAAPIGNENSTPKPANDILVNLTVVMSRGLIEAIDKKRALRTDPCNRSAFIREVLENAL